MSNDLIRTWIGKSMRQKVGVVEWRTTILCWKKLPKQFQSIFLCLSIQLDYNLFKARYFIKHRKCLEVEPIMVATP